MTEEQQHHQETSASIQNQTKPPAKDRKNVNDLRNQDYVSRLLAATPPYLYSAPVGPNNFFFSDMLRSLVQARNNENARNLQMQQAAIIARRPRKRSWSQHRPYYEQLRERKGLDEKISVPEKPLELTNKQFLPISAAKYPRPDSVSKESICNKGLNESSSIEGQTIMQDSSAATSLPPQDLVLPPPPPVWYPPIYPPYGIDPLHFFIDLRVSGHIYDRKKENVSPLTNAENNTLVTSDSETSGKYRQGSAFSVPVPRSESKGSTAINLSSSSSSSASETSNKFENYTKYYDLGETKENLPSPKNSSNYMLQNLPRLYGQFAAATKDLNDDNSYENENKSDQDCDDSIDGHGCGNCRENSSHIDVEMVDSLKFQSEEMNSGCVSPEECEVNDHNTD